jgi:aminoglycoside phosphotransferase (APT) family kinase protein
MREPHSRLEELTSSFGLFVRESHKKTLDAGFFGSAKEKSMEILRQYDRLSISREASDRLLSMFDTMIPRSEEFSHGDCHAGNVMLKDGCFMFIDVGRMSCGHLIYDLWSMFLQYRYHAYHHMGEVLISPLAKDFSPEERALIWDSYFLAATGIRDEELKRKAEKQISVFAGIRLLEARFYLKGFLPDEIYDQLIEELLAYEAQGCEPLVF